MSGPAHLKPGAEVLVGDHHAISERIHDATMYDTMLYHTQRYFPNREIIAHRLPGRNPSVRSPQACLPMAAG